MPRTLPFFISRSVSIATARRCLLWTMMKVRFLGVYRDERVDLQGLEESGRGHSAQEEALPTLFGHPRHSTGSVKFSVSSQKEPTHPTVLCCWL